MGYDYTLIQKLGEDKNMVINLIIAPSISSMLNMIESGTIDVAAYDVPITGETLEIIIPCGYEHLSKQMLVQKKGKGALREVTDLIDKDIYVERDSKYFHRLNNLNEELGGGINIHVVDEDSIISEDLLEMVSNGEIQYTVVDSDVALFNKSYFPDLDITVDLSFPQRSSWAVSKGKAWLGDTISQWFSSIKPMENDRQLLRRYFELSRSQRLDSHAFRKNFSKGYISEYDDIFKNIAKEINWDWRLMAAMGYAESRFDNDVVSWAGAKGIMQIMPATARAFKTDIEHLVIPKDNIRLASEILTSLDKSLESYISDSSERKFFVIAAYNSGLAHILDAINIAKAYGLDPTKWKGNVAEALKMKSQPEVYNNNEICRYGYFKGTYTTAYVNNVMNLYDLAVKGLPS